MKTLKIISFLIAFLVLGLVMAIGYGHWQTEKAIENYNQQVIAISQETPPPQNQGVFSQLPTPVQRYFHFTFGEQIPTYRYVQFSAEGQFRRPLKEDFAFTTASQTIARQTPALSFAATTPIVTGIWARAFDAYVEGHMEMKAKIVSLITVVDEKSTPALNQTSLQRWLLESAVNPASLLPGGPVRWEPIDNTHARAIVSAHGYEATLLATFRDDGSIETMTAETDGDLTTPYHGAGEYVLRENYTKINGMMIPTQFTIARAANGKIYPFWQAKITHIEFN